MLYFLVDFYLWGCMLMKKTLTFGAVLKFLFHAYVIIFAFVLFLFYILFPDADSLCSDSSFCPIGGYVYRDFVCGKSVWVTEEYCRYFGGKLEDGLCDATYSLYHRKRCEAAGGKFVKTRWFTGICDFRKKCNAWTKIDTTDDVSKSFRGTWREHGSMAYFEEKNND